MEPDIEINDHASRFCADPQIDLDWIESHLHRAIAQIRHPIHRVTVRVVDDLRMAQLHEQHLGVSGTTDVITFPESESDAPIEVDIAVCLDEARREAAERSHAVEQELLLYILHGLLHCAGFDDGDAADFDAMHQEEDRILSAIGVGATFTGTAQKPDSRTARKPESGTVDEPEGTS